MFFENFLPIIRAHVAQRQAAIQRHDNASLRHLRHEILLDTIYRRAYGPARGAEPPTFPLNKRTRRALESMQIFGEVRGYDLAEGLEVIRDPDAWADIYNQLMEIHFGKSGSRFKYKIYPAMTLPLDPSPLGKKANEVLRPHENRWVRNELTGKRERVRVFGDVGMPAQGAGGSMPGDYVAKLRSFGWLDENGVFRPPKVKTAQNAAEHLRVFANSFFPDDIKAMPSTVTDTVNRWVEMVTDDYTSRTAGLQAEILKNREKARALNVSLLVDDLTFRQQEQVRGEIVDLNKATAELVARRRVLSSEEQEIGWLLQRVTPRDAARVSDPVGSLKQRLHMHNEAAKRVREDPEYLEYLRSREKAVRQSFRSENRFFRSLAYSGVEGDALAGPYSGMRVTGSVVNREDYVFDVAESRWRKLTRKERVEGVVEGGRQIPIEELKARGRIRVGKAMKITPTGLSLDGRLSVLEGVPEADIRPIGALRLVDDRLSARGYSRLIGRKDYESVSEAIDRVARDVSERIGSVVGGPVYGPMEALDPRTIAQDLFARALYGKGDERDQAFRAISNTMKDKSPYSKAIMAQLEKLVPELRGMSTISFLSAKNIFSRTAADLGIPFNREGYRARINQTAAEVVRETSHLSRKVDSLDSMTAERISSFPDIAPDPEDVQIRRRYATYQSRLQDLRGMVSDDLRSLQAEAVDPQTLSRIYQRYRIDPSAGQGNLYDRVLGLSRRVGNLSEDQLRVLMRATEEGTFEAFSALTPSAYPEAVRELYGILRSFSDPLRANQRAEITTRALREVSRKPRRYADNVIMDLLAERDLSPGGLFSGQKEEVITRVHEWAQQNAVLRIENASGVQDYTFSSAKELDDGLEIILKDQAGQTHVTSLGWQPLELDPDQSIAQARKIMVERVKEDLRRHLGVTGSGSSRGRQDQRFLDLLNDATARIDKFLMAAPDRVTSALRGQGTFVQREVSDFMLAETSRLLVDYELGPKDIPLRGRDIGRGLVRQAYFAEAGFGDISTIPELYSQSLFETDALGETRLARPFSPLTRIKGGALARMDDVSDDARTAITDAIEAIRENLAAREIDLDEVIRLSEAMQDAEISPALEEKLLVEGDQFGFRRSRGRMSPILGAGNRLNLPASFSGIEIDDDIAKVLEKRPIKSGDMPTLAEAFAQAVYYMQGGKDRSGQVATDRGGQLIDAISDALANQMHTVKKPELAEMLPRSMFEALYPDRIPDEVRGVSDVAEEIGEGFLPKQTRATRASVAELFRSNKTLQAAAIGGAAFLAWGVVQSRREKDHAQNDMVIPHLPGGSPYSQTPVGPRSVDMPSLSGGGGGELYYIDAQGALDPTGFQSQVQGITGGRVYGTVNTRSNPMQSRRLSVEERLNG